MKSFARIELTIEGDFTKSQLEAFAERLEVQAALNGINAFDTEVRIVSSITRGEA